MDSVDINTKLLHETVAVMARHMKHGQHKPIVEVHLSVDRHEEAEVRMIHMAEPARSVTHVRRVYEHLKPTFTATTSPMGGERTTLWEHASSKDATEHLNYICTHAQIHTHIHTRTHARTRTHTHTHTYTHMHACDHT